MEVAAQRHSLPGRVIGVAFAPPASVATFERGLGLDVPILCDPERVAYHVFGFGRVAWARAILHPGYLVRLARALRRGRRFSRVREDPSQLGGDVVLDAEGRVRWVYRSRWPADRPSVDDVRAALLAAA